MSKKRKGIVLLGEDAQLEKLAQGKGYAVTRINGWNGWNGETWPFDKVLFVEPGTEVPWDLLPAAWHFLERWDAAVPLWRYGVNACDVGSKEERKATQAVVRDLRVLLHSVELLFVRGFPDEDGQTLGRDLVAAYSTELTEGTDKRLAFLRAVYQVKPRLCVLPRSWLAKVQARSKQDAMAVRGRGRPRAARLVEVEIGPGHFVKCHPGDEAAVLEMYKSGRRR